MHFAIARKYVAVIIVAAVVTLAIVAVLSLPRSYILMATTTSTRDTGLLPYLLPQFTADTGIEVRYTAVGTGQALDAGRRGDVDVVMVHAPSLEAAFMASNDGLCRNMIMYNRFVIVGPASDPAGTGNAASAAEAFLRIYQNASQFESRADNSGTYNKELELWRAAGLDVSTFGGWYEKTNQGMGATLTIANNREYAPGKPGAYTLSDDGTWYALESNLRFLRLLYHTGEAVLRNQYSVIPVNPATHPGVLSGKAVEFAKWLVGSRGQSLIGNFTVNGTAIFTPDFVPGDPQECPRSYILMATTTSTRDTGLLPYLLPQFTADTGIDVRYTAVGTGQALDAGRRGDVDIVMVDAPSLEAAFMASNDGLCRNMIMYNRFVIVGPANDPAGIANATSAADAFRRIFQNSSQFESRADNSGTYNRELELWRAAGLNVSTFGGWYERTNQGMGATLTIANNRAPAGYALSDDGTWYALESNLRFLRLLYHTGEAVLRNQHSVIPVNPGAHPGVLSDKAVEFAKWLVGARGQGLIGNYTVNGHAIFTPDFVPGDPQECR